MKVKPDKCKHCGMRRVLDDNQMCWECLCGDFDRAQCALEEHPSFDRKTRVSSAPAKEGQ
jgi:hypothetical protein